MLLGQAWVEQVIHSQLELDLVVQIIHVGKAGRVGQLGLDVVCSIVNEVGGQADFLGSSGSEVVEVQCLTDGLGGSEGYVSLPDGDIVEGEAIESCVLRRARRTYRSHQTASEAEPDVDYLSSVGS